MNNKAFNELSFDVSKTESMVPKKNICGTWFSIEFPRLSYKLSLLTHECWSKIDLQIIEA